jgi:hypothetical protein
MKYVFEMGLVAMLHIPSFINMGLGIQKSIRRIHRCTDSMEIA